MSVESPTQTARFNSIEECLADIRQGRIIVVTDDEDRENEGDLIMAAEKVTPEAVNFMTKNGRGLICVPTTESRLKALGIGRMVAENRESFKTDFMVSIDARNGITTGISAPDRARSIRVLADPNAASDDVVSPGHIFPLQAREGGVLRRAGHTEASVDLVKMAGLFPVAVLCEILNEDGTMARLPDLMKFKDQFGLRSVRFATSSNTAGCVRNWSRKSRRFPCPRRTASSNCISIARWLTASITRRWSWAMCAARRTCWSACTANA